MFAHSILSTVRAFATSPATHTAAKEIGKYALKTVATGAVVGGATSGLVDWGVRGWDRVKHDTKVQERWESLNVDDLTEAEAFYLDPETHSADNCYECERYDSFKNRSKAEKISSAAGYIAKAGYGLAKDNWVSILLYSGSRVFKATPWGRVLTIGLVSWEIGKVTWSINKTRKARRDLRVSKMNLDALLMFDSLGDDLADTFTEMELDPLFAATCGTIWGRELIETEPTEREIKDMITAVEKVLVDEGMNETSKKNFLNGVRMVATV